MDMIENSLSKEEQEAIIDFYVNKGKSLTAISIMYAVDIKSVRGFLTKNGIEIRPSKKGDGSAKRTIIKLLEEGEKDVDKLAEEAKCTRPYALDIIRTWQKEQGPQKDEPFDFMKARFGEYITTDKLRAFADTIHVGDRINMREVIRDGSLNTYMLSGPGRNSVVVTILEKHKNIVITDRGAKQWVEIWDAVRRYGKAP